MAATTTCGDKIIGVLIKLRDVLTICLPKKKQTETPYY